MSIPIQKPFLIVVEGPDDEAVLEFLLGHLGIPSVQIVNANGKDSIRNVVTVLAGQEGYRQVQGVGIVRDADSSPESAQQSCEDSLRGLEKKSAYFVLPGDGPGMLEELCLRAVLGRPEIDCVDRFMECLGANGTRLSNLSKFRMKAFLMVHDEDTARRIGWAAVRGLLDPAHPAFAPLRQFLLDFTRV